MLDNDFHYEGGYGIPNNLVVTKNISVTSIVLHILISHIIIFFSGVST